MLCSEFVQDVEFLEGTCQVERCTGATGLSKILEVLAISCSQSSSLVLAQ
jgi:hypothetical protein